MNYFGDKKFKVGSKEESKALQEFLFVQGFAWAHKEKIVQLENEPYLYTDNSDNTITFTSSTSEAYFNEQENKQLYPIFKLGKLIGFTEEPIVLAKEVVQPIPTSSLQLWALTNFMSGLGYVFVVKETTGLQDDGMGAKGNFKSNLKDARYENISVNNAIRLYNCKQWLMAESGAHKVPAMADLSGFKLGAYFVDRAVRSKPFKKLKLYYSKENGIQNGDHWVEFTEPYYKNVFLGKDA
jgi:hypothetical protein